MIETKHYCDVCEREITDINCIPNIESRLQGNKRLFSINFKSEAINGFEFTNCQIPRYHFLDICRLCLIDKLKEIE